MLDYIANIKTEISLMENMIKSSLKDQKKSKRKNDSD